MSLWDINPPFAFQMAFFVTVITYKEPNYGDGYVYQPYAIAIGFLISIIPMLPVPIMMVREMTKLQGPILKVRAQQFFHYLSDRFEHYENTPMQYIELFFKSET